LYVVLFFSVIFPSDENSDETSPNLTKNDFELVQKIGVFSNCEEDLNFCENIESYPVDYLKNVLRGNDIYRELFETKDLEDDVTNRIGDEDSFICRSVVKDIFPKIGRNTKNKWRYIVNQEEFVQTVRIEVCRNEGKPCDLIGELPNGYTTTCKQKYIYTRLLSLTINGFPNPDIFPLPSACACSYKKNFDFLARMGSPVSPIRSKRRTV
ncbi:hypothetical protein NQ314_011902, partial [Rhamnusium bicolor]